MTGILGSLFSAEAYLEPGRTSTIEIFSAKIVNRVHLLVHIKKSVLYIACITVLH